MITVTNPRFCVQVNAGKKGFVVSSITDLKYQKEWLYREENASLGRNTKESFDGQYAGGMEILFPCDEPEHYQGIFYEDHGWLWRMHYEVTETADGIRAEAIDKTRETYAVYELHLLNDKIRLAIAVTNHSNRDLPYLLRLHPAFVFQKDTKLELNAAEILFEKEAAYCSFIPQRPVIQSPYINTQNGICLDINTPDTWKEHELFCHIRQNKGEFSITDKQRRLSVIYEQEKLPYLTMYSCMKNGSRIGLPEPANVPGISMKSIAGCRKIKVLAAKQTAAYEFDIIPE